MQQELQYFKLESTLHPQISPKQESASYRLLSMYSIYQVQLLRTSCAKHFMPDTTATPPSLKIHMKGSSCRCVSIFYQMYTTN